MQVRRLGQQGLEVSAVGLGCMGMSWAYSGYGDDDRSIATLRQALDLGITLIDTAEVYGPYTNERLVGRALAGHRSEAVIATKFGFRIAPDGRMVGLDSHPDHIRAVVDASLDRLGVDRIDLLYQHRVDPVVPIEDVVGAMSELVAAGKVAYLGLSEASPATLRRAHAVHPITALQSEYSLWERGVESEILPACRALGVGFVAYSPLGRGFLTGQATRAEEMTGDDSRRAHPRFQAANFDRNRARVDELRRLAAGLRATPAQVALAWLLHQGQDIVPIFGTKSPERLRENVVAAALALSTETLAELGRIFAPGSTAGTRYNDAGLSTIDRSV